MVQLLERSGRRQVADRVKVGQRVDDQDAHRAVQKTKRIALGVKEEDVGQAQHQARYGHGQHGHELGHHPAGGKSPGFLQQVGANKHDHRANQGCPDGQLHRVPVGGPAVGIKFAKGVVVQRQRQVVRPARDQRGPGCHGQHHRNHAADHATKREQRPVTPGCRLGHQRHSACRQQRHLALLEDTVSGKCHHRRDQQHKAHHRAHLEVLLADHLFEDIRRQHIEASANHLGNAEVGDDQGKNHEAGADQAVFGAWQGDGQEHAGLGGAQGVGSLIQPRIGHGQCCQQNHQCVRKTVEHLGHHDAKRPVNRHAEHPAFEKALVAKQIDQ